MIFLQFISLSLLAQSTDLEAKWDEGLKFESRDGNFNIRVGGRVHYDMAFLRQASALDTVEGGAGSSVEVRRARLAFSGAINNRFEYEFEFTFGETVSYADLYVAFLRVPVVDRVTIGHFREPFGMEEQINSNYIVFMERSLTSALGISRNTGIMLQKKLLRDKLHIYTGIYRITDELAEDLEGDGNHSLSTRFAYNPLYDSTANRALHIGLALNTRTPNDNEYEIKSYNETNTGARYIRTGMLEHVKNVRQIGGELGYSEGNLCLQGEYVHAFARLSEIEDELTEQYNREFNAYYLMASYFLKRGSRKYNVNSNEFSSVSLDEHERLKGAWELGLRYSRINLLHTDRQFSSLADVTLGLNWYFNASTRMMMNYVYSRINGNYTANSLQFRVQVSF
ncbi:OprO/OprP family phosphate-selective porin [Pontibacter sp. SGAir0037]|uniref:OprO/OprP family phosphate-selective porin n=1 Tax=Pontibacter sp. SGAir0037 TaxID=2571030 RepID=UPI00143D3170|nr:porin [Pontibacter sp. SGAir0037]